jgi:hypothetical protein
VTGVAAWTTLATTSQRDCPGADAPDSADSNDCSWRSISSTKAAGRSVRPRGHGKRSRFPTGGRPSIAWPTVWKNWESAQSLWLPFRKSAAPTSSFAMRGSPRASPRRSNERFATSQATRSMRETSRTHDTVFFAAGSKIKTRLFGGLNVPDRDPPVKAKVRFLDRRVRVQVDASIREDMGLGFKTWMDGRYRLFSNHGWRVFKLLLERHQEVTRRCKRVIVEMAGMEDAVSLLPSVT